MADRDPCPVCKGEVRAGPCYGCGGTGWARTRAKMLEGATVLGGSSEPIGVTDPAEVVGE